MKLLYLALMCLSALAIGMALAYLYEFIQAF